MTPVEIQVRNAFEALDWNAREWHRFRHATGATLYDAASFRRLFDMTLD